MECFDYDNNIVEIKYSDLNINSKDVDKSGYQHFMLKEINEQPKVLKTIIDNYFTGESIVLNKNLIDVIRSSDKINLVGSGTSMYACFMGKYYFEKMCGIPSEVFCASELVYSKPLILDNPCFIFVTQSGETADSIAVLKRFKDEGYPIIVISNSKLSTMNMLADYTLDLCAGKEISVASTKAYTAEVAVLVVLAFGVLNKNNTLRNDLFIVSNLLETILNNTAKYELASQKLKKSKSIFFIGRGIDYWVSMEASLKMKEISYIHTEAFSSGELKHGAIALIDENTSVIAICSQDGTNSITRSNLEEAKARGAQTFVISVDSLSEENDDFIVPNTKNYLTPLLTAVVSQCLAYYTAKELGNDIDKPRNLAKSVTVE